MRRAMGRLSDPADVGEEVSRVLAASTLKLVSDGFLKEQDPYGNPWEELRYRRGRTLRLTGRMWNSRGKESGARGFRVFLSAWYSVIHQEGTRPRRRRMVRLALARRGLAGGDGSIPARPMVPDDRGLPDHWRDVYRKDTLGVLKRRSRLA